MPLEFVRDGAEHYPALATRSLADLLPLFHPGEPVAGRRLDCLGETRRHLESQGAIGSLASRKLGRPARPVRAIAFEKADGANWMLNWHQDRVIAVRARVDVEGYGPWTVKQGQYHVQPPAQLLARMATIRINLDAIDAANAPLKVAPGSHKFGRIEEHEIRAMVARCGQATCLAEAGDAWIYATLILHASNRSAPGRRRRVLQVDYATEDLPGGLEWHLA